MAKPEKTTTATPESTDPNVVVTKTPDGTVIANAVGAAK